ncbi:maltooligosyl trehalose hydrolase [Mucilaginibacter gracilis]|uniref:Malto-oligosyltrehalose trehalohydrolase n=1 Tax=Mucilaginibacter gracilis TaxID=423350 RepID=A0A495J7N4_9SPHI|nr:malto-oligosyltrehalose trehalohydrolase [Mucilaginibacter gracilis]RKR84374.1 maltooligosyl trehalose hydrolase [Mucilaginibacter gracilis]
MREIGINFGNKTALVQLWAPQAKKVELLVTDAGHRLALKKGHLGHWSLQTDEIKPGDKYQFVLDDDKKLPDPASLAQPDGVHGPSQAVDLNALTWTDKQWTNPPLADYIFYELHTGTFTPEGTFDAIIPKLDHLVALGITAIEIMPVAQFAGGRNWGYDGVFPFAVQNTYGGADGLNRLVNACHEKGLAVVLDVVYNHIGPEGNYFANFAPYFTSKYQTPWGDAINFDDAGCDGVREYFIENALMWFRDFHIDALRMDAVHAIKDLSAKHILQEITERVDILQQQTGRNYYLIVECDLNDTRYINPLKHGGYGINAQWTDEFHHALRVSAGQQQNGYYSDFNGLADLAKAYMDGYVYTGQYSAHREKKFGSQIVNNPGQQFVVFSQNHDQVGNRMLGERSNQLYSLQMQKLLAAAVMVSPYLPMLFMGEEMGETNPFLYFTSHQDPELAEAVRKGRKAEFKAFHAEGEAPDPQSVNTFQNSKIQWQLLQNPERQTMFEYYKALIALRKQLPALKTLNRKNVKVEVDTNKQTLTLYRWHQDQVVVCLMNFSKQEKPVNLRSEIKQWDKVFDSAEPKWNGLLASPQKINSGVGLKLQPQSVIIYTKAHV